MKIKTLVKKEYLIINIMLPLINNEMLDEATLSVV